MNGIGEHTRERFTPALAALAFTVPFVIAAAPAQLDPAETLEYDGSGDTVLEVVEHDQPRVASFSHQGSSNFAVWAIDSRGEEQDLLVNTIGPYEGTVLYNVLVGEDLAALDISADGTWEVSLKPLEETERWPSGDDEAAGDGDEVLFMEWEPEGLTVLDIDYGGESNFAIWAYTDSDRDLLVNEIGPYSGQARLVEGTMLLAITAEGGWTLTR
ncbi:MULTISPECIES: hypothetical protein [unclassified Nocardiopsis]|uniref:hypothetical protein n=1 Tax=Nocardiopsis TaxID=2013 RepID=UPI00387B0EB1